MADDTTRTEDPGAGNTGTDDDVGRGGRDTGGEAPREITKLRQEAAGHRRRLREAEQERDRLADRLRSMEHTEIERIASQRMMDGADLWTRVGLDDLRGDDSSVDFDKVTVAVDEAIRDKPHWKRPHVHGDADQGKRTTTRGPVTWAEALRPGRT